MQRLRARVRPGRARKPGEAVPDAAPVRRGAGPVPPAPAREGRACRAFLSGVERPRSACRRACRSTGRRRRRPLHRRLDRMLEHEAGDLTCTVEAGVRLSALQRGARSTRADARARPARRPDDRRVPGGEPVRAAAAPLRDDARPRHRRHGGARRRHGRELGRQGGEERRRLRPRPSSSAVRKGASDGSCASRSGFTLCPEATATVVAPADPDRGARRAAFRPHTERRRSPLARLARAALRRVGAGGRSAGGGGARADRWRAGRRGGLGRGRRAPGRRGGRISFAPGSLADVLAAEDEAVVRVAAGVAYVPHPVADPRDPAEIALVERIRAPFDPAGVLA